MTSVPPALEESTVRDDLRVDRVTRRLELIDQHRFGNRVVHLRYGLVLRVHATAGSAARHTAPVGGTKLS